MASYFAQNRFVVNMVDLRSFGYSGGERVNTSIAELLCDIENLLRRCCEMGLPTYIVAHGFGSLLTLALLQENPGLPIAGVVSMSPLFAFPYFANSSFLGRALLRGLSWVFPEALISNAINPTALTNNDAHVKGCIDGVFNYQFMTVTMATKYAELSEKVIEDAPKFKYPLLVLYGARDMIQPKREVKLFYQSVGSKEKSSYILRNGFHQLYKDQEVEEELLPKILEWIDLLQSKKTVKWTKTDPFRIRVIRKVHPIWRWLVLVLIPLLAYLLRKKIPLLC